jgi:DNA-binding LytR/AlgR family response regulator
MVLNCIALDDEPIALDVIRSHCQGIDFIDLKEVFTSASAAQKYLNKHPVDLIFLDIQMPDINGISFYKRLKHNIMVIFTTAYSNYAVEGFNVNAIDYILKPMEFARFRTACEKAREYAEYIKAHSSSEQQSMYIRSEYALVKIELNEILYLETLDDYVKIHLENKKPVLTLMSMKKMLEKLPASDFERVHRSYIVPLKKIDSLRSKTISIGEKKIPLGVSYEKEFRQKYRGN